MKTIGYDKFSEMFCEYLTRERIMSYADTEYACDCCSFCHVKWKANAQAAVDSFCKHAKDCMDVWQTKEIDIDDAVRIISEWKVDIDDFVESEDVCYNFYVDDIYDYEGFYNDFANMVKDRFCLI